MRVAPASARNPEAEHGRPEPRRAAGPRGPELLLSLQRTAGNQAVARLVGGSAAPRGTLARFGVQVLTGDKLAVEGIQVNGRPKERLIPGAEGSHVTAWAVFADLVRRKLVGLTAGDALDEARTLLSDQIASLTLEWPDPKPKAVTEALPKAQNVVDAIDAGGGGGAVEVSQLQEAITHYLTLHNLRKGTAVLIGKALAIGAGEPGHLSKLRMHEAGADQKPEDLRAAMFGLLDVKALKFIGGLGAATPAAPGVDPADADRVGKAVVRGLHDLAEAYPRAYQAAITQTEVENWLGGQGLPTTLPGGVPVVGGTPGTAPAGWSRTGKDAITAEINKRAAVCQIILDPPKSGGAATDAVVREVVTAGRPRTLFKSDQGHHAVAFKLESMRLDTLRGKTLAVAADLLNTLAYEAVDELDDAYAALKAEDTDAIGYDQDRADYTAEVFSEAVTELEGLADAFKPDSTDAAQLLLDAQDLAGSWMRAAAVLPLSTADVGGPAGGKGEGKAIAVLKAYEKTIAETKKNPGVRKTDEARENLIMLMDKEAIAWLAASDTTGIGYPESHDERVGLILRRWLRAAKDSFPNAYQDTEIGTVDRLRPVVDALKLRLDDPKKVVQIALGMAVAPDWIDEEHDEEAGWSGGEDEPEKKKRKKAAKERAKKRKTKRRPAVKR